MCSKKELEDLNKESEQAEIEAKEAIAESKLLY